LITRVCLVSERASNYFDSKILSVRVRVVSLINRDEIFVLV